MVNAECATQFGRQFADTTDGTIARVESKRWQFSRNSVTIDFDLSVVKSKFYVAREKNNRFISEYYVNKFLPEVNSEN